MSIVYETMFILRPDLGDEQVEQAITKYQNLLKEHGAEDIQIQNRGKRRLAYEIKKQRMAFTFNSTILKYGNCDRPCRKGYALKRRSNSLPDY